jgi:TolA-binding protein
MKTKIFLVAMVAVTVSGCGRNSSNDDISSVKKQITELQQQVENLPNDSAKIAEIDKKIDNLQNDEAELSQKNKELTQKNDELESQLSALQESGGYEVFVDTLFPSDGKTYVINPDYQDDVVIYSDTTCTAKLEKFPEFASSKYIDSNAENGLSIHCYRTINNNIVYTTKTIELKEK